jgi:phytoene/squalene synthetase
MKHLYDTISLQCSKGITRTYSTSFSLGIRVLSRKYHDPIYAIYGFVRLADEIVDTFHEFDKTSMIAELRRDTVQAIERKISINPVLNSFQEVVHKYNIEWPLIDKFLVSMEMDLDKKEHDGNSYSNYIYGSAEVVGLMCLRVFTEGNDAWYQELKPYAMKLGSAFQKVNFLRDIKADYVALGRTYFPQYQGPQTEGDWKRRIEEEIRQEFNEALVGIKKLPRGARLGVYVAYRYYLRLFHKIQAVPPQTILESRVRVPDGVKAGILISSACKHYLRLV